MGDIKVTTKEYGSKNEAASKILKLTDKVVIPHLLYLIDFLVKTGETNFYVRYDRYINNGNSSQTINYPDLQFKDNHSIRIYLNLSEKTIRITGDRFNDNNNGEHVKLTSFKNYVSESCGDPERIAICDGLIRYTEILQEELYKIETMDNKIDVFRKTVAKREVIVEKEEEDGEGAGD